MKVIVVKDVLKLIIDNMEAFKILQKYPNTFKMFREWLYLKLNKNTNSFKSFGSYSDFNKTPYFLAFLEDKGVNILDAFCYYNYETSNTKTFTQLSLYLVYREFYNLENNIKLDYNVF